jgi:hypothetical protein
MSGPFARLKAAGCRVDGLNLKPDGTIAFVATNAGGAWSDDQKNAVKAALGLSVPTPAQLERSFGRAVQLWLDQTAQAAGYDNLMTAVSYGGSTIDLWQRQAIAFAAWRDAVWAAAIALLAAVEAGTHPLPGSDADLIAALPRPAIPTS